MDAPRASTHAPSRFVAFAVAAFAKIASESFGAWTNFIEVGTFVACLAIWIVFHLWFLFKVQQVKAETHAHLNGALRASEAAEKRHLELAESKAHAQAAQRRAMTDLM